MASIIAHELAESVTDPQINAWCARLTRSGSFLFPLVRRARSGCALTLLSGLADQSKVLYSMSQSGSPAADAWHGLQVQCGRV